MRCLCLFSSGEADAAAGGAAVLPVSLRHQRPVHGARQRGRVLLPGAVRRRPLRRVQARVHQQRRMPARQSMRALQMHRPMPGRMRPERRVSDHQPQSALSLCGRLQRRPVDGLPRGARHTGHARGPLSPVTVRVQRRVPQRRRPTDLLLPAVLHRHTAQLPA